jgi:hypothetical protein
MTFQQRNSKKIQPEYPESETELEFHFQWGSQKSGSKIGIPNLVGEDKNGDAKNWADNGPVGPPRGKCQGLGT